MQTSETQWQYRAETFNLVHLHLKETFILVFCFFHKCEKYLNKNIKIKFSFIGHASFRDIQGNKDNVFMNLYLNHQALVSESDTK